MIAGFISANCELLVQLEQVVGKLSAQEYAELQTEVFDASIGGHVRHLLDHYENFLTAVLEEFPAEVDHFRLREQKPMINYDDRPRQRSVELDVDIAKERSHALRHALEHLPRDNIDVDIILQIDSAPENALQSSTLARELSFLYSHSVHHLAIISSMLKALGLEDMPRNFGIAPSTVKFREAM